MRGFFKFVAWLVGIDDERRVAGAVESLARRVITTREIVGAYHTADEEEVAVNAWTNGTTKYGGGPEAMADQQAGADQRVSRHVPGVVGLDFGSMLDREWFRAYAEADPPTPEAQLGGIVNEPTSMREAVDIAFAMYGGTSRPQLATAGNYENSASETAESADNSGNASTRPPEGAQLRKRSSADRSRIIRLASAAAKRRFGLPKATEANLLVVAKAVRDWLEERGVRPTHIEHIAPMATAAVFIPTQADIDARAMLASRAALDQAEAFEATYWTAGTKKWWKPTTWFGRAYARPPAG